MQKGAMKELAIYLRALQLYAHNAHNLAKGKTFFEDHEFFGSLYAAYEAAYDSVVERIIGETGDCDLNEVTKKACDIVYSKKFTDNDAALKFIMTMEKELCGEIESINDAESLGTQNLVQGIADESLARQYKISRRLKP